MKKRLFLCVALLAGIAGAQMSSMRLVEITDLAGNKGYEIMDATAYNELTKQLQEEQKVFNQLMLEARQKWAENEEVKDIKFPATIVKARKARLVMQGKEEQLLKKKEKQEEVAAKALEKEQAKIDAKLKNVRDPAQLEKLQAKEELKAKAQAAAVGLMSHLLGEKVGRTIPAYGTLSLGADNPFAAQLKAAAEKK